MRILIILLIFISELSNAQTVQWAIRAGGAAASNFGSEDDMITCVKTDNQGNIYICGNFYGSSSNINNVPISNNGDQDIFIAKLDCNANLLWVKTAGGSQSEVGAESIELDSNGHLYITGWLTAQPSSKWSFFDTLIGDSILIQSWYLAQFDTSGNYLWSHMASNDFHNSSHGYDIEIDNSGKPVVSVFTYDQEVMPGLNLDTGFYFLVFDTIGSLSKVIRPNYGHSSIDLKHFRLDSQNNAYSTGSWQGDSIDVNGTILYSAHPGSVAQHNFMLYACDSAGNTKWYHQFTDTLTNQNVQIGRSIILDSSNNVYITGQTYRNMVSDNYLFTAPPNWSSDIQFVAKFDNSGNQQWINSFPFQYGGRTNTSGITIRPNGNILTAHVYQSKSLIGNDTIYPSPNSLMDIVLTEIAPTGSIVSHEELHGMGGDHVFSITCTNNDAVYLAGAFESQLNINSQVLTSTGGKTDGYLARFGGICTTSLSEVSSDIKLTAFPNPVYNTLTITWENQFMPVNYKILSATGAIIDNGHLINNPIEFQYNTVELTEGIYLLQLTDETGQVAATRFIKN